MDFTKQIRKADVAAKKRNYDFAVELYQQILDIDLDQGEARAGLRQALKKRHDSKKGGGGFFRALSGAPQLAAARALHKARKFDACAKTLESLLASNPLDEDANLLLGMALEDGGHYRSARAVYEFIAEIAPRNCQGLKRAGAMTARLGDHEKALEYYERALAIDPRDQESIKARKDMSAERAMAKSSLPIGHSREQIKDKDRSAEMEREKRLHQSDDELREELARLEARYAESRDVAVMERMAEVHEKLKDPETALEWVERVLSYKKDDPALVARAADLRGKALKKAIVHAGKTGDEARAGQLERELWRHEADELRRRIASNPGDLASRLQLGRRLLRLGELDGAMAELQKTTSDPRNRREAQFLLAQCFQAKGFRDLARKEYNNALDGAPQNDERAKEILYNLGALAEDDQDVAAARAFYSRVFEVDIGYRDVAQKMERFR
ncbi:MAG: tetratricopeptide repeat protein [Planctomycetes bacterium]|nr:tetratricopeptide repeat protein [Planctomycetota bacterium]